MKNKFSKLRKIVIALIMVFSMSFYKIKKRLGFIFIPASLKKFVLIDVCFSENQFDEVSFSLFHE